MTLNNELTNLANQFRNTYGVSNKFGISDMIAGFTGLEAKDYLDHSNNAGVGSYTTDPTEDTENWDIMRTHPISPSNGTYNLSWDMRGSGNFSVYAWPINKYNSESHLSVDLTSDWKRYNFTFTVSDVDYLNEHSNGFSFFVRVNSDHESKHFEVNNWKLVKLK